MAGRSQSSCSSVARNWVRSFTLGRFLCTSRSSLVTRTRQSGVIVERVSFVRQNATIQFCKAFQTGKCTFTKDHYGQIRNERKWVQHICPKCWLTKQEVERQPENSPECPFASSSSNTSPSQTTHGSLVSWLSTAITRDPVQSFRPVGRFR